MPRISVISSVYDGAAYQDRAVPSIPPSRSWAATRR